MNKNMVIMALLSASSAVKMNTHENEFADFPVILMSKNKPQAIINVEPVRDHFSVFGSMEK